MRNYSILPVLVFFAACLSACSAGFAPDHKEEPSVRPLPDLEISAECKAAAADVALAKNGARIIFCESFDQDNGTNLGNDTTYWGTFD